MKDKVLVKVEGVSKKICRHLKRSFWYGVQDISSELWLCQEWPTAQGRVLGGGRCELAYRQTGFVFRTTK